MTKNFNLQKIFNFKNTVIFIAVLVLGIDPGTAICGFGFVENIYFFASFTFR